MGLRLYDSVHFPTWALCAVYNDDYSGLTDEDTADVQKFLRDYEGMTFDVPNPDEIHFDPYPLFGKGSDVVTMDIYCED